MAESRDLRFEGEQRNRRLALAYIVHNALAEAAKREGTELCEVKLRFGDSQINWQDIVESQEYQEAKGEFDRGGQLTQQAIIEQYRQTLAEDGFVICDPQGRLVHAAADGPGSEYSDDEDDQRHGPRRRRGSDSFGAHDSFPNGGGYPALAQRRYEPPIPESKWTGTLVGTGLAGASGFLIGTALVAAGVALPPLWAGYVGLAMVALGAGWMHYKMGHPGKHDVFNGFGHFVHRMYDTSVGTGLVAAGAVLATAALVPLSPMVIGFAGVAMVFGGLAVGVKRPLARKDVGEPGNRLPNYLVAAGLIGLGLFLALTVPPVWFLLVAAAATFTAAAVWVHSRKGQRVGFDEALLSDDDTASQSLCHGRAQAVAGHTAGNGRCPAGSPPGFEDGWTRADGYGGTAYRSSGVSFLPAPPTPRRDESQRLSGGAPARVVGSAHSQWDQGHEVDARPVTFGGDR